MPRPFRWTWYLSLRKFYGEFRGLLCVGGLTVQFVGPIFGVRILTDDVVVVSDHRIAEELVRFAA